MFHMHASGGSNLFVAVKPHIGFSCPARVWCSKHYGADPSDAHLFGWHISGHTGLMFISPLRRDRHQLLMQSADCQTVGDITHGDHISEATPTIGRFSACPRVKLRNGFTVQVHHPLVSCS